MNNRKTKRKTSIIKINNKNKVGKKRESPKINLFLSKKYTSRNDNNKRENILLKIDKEKEKKFVSLTSDMYHINKESKNGTKKNDELSKETDDKNNQTLKNKSSDDLPKTIRKYNNFKLMRNEDINQINNPINIKFFFTNDYKTDNEQNNSQDESKMILNKRIYRRNIIHKSNLFDNNSNKLSAGYSHNSSTFSSDILKRKISKIVKDISKKHRNTINTFNNDSTSITKTSSIFILKKDRNKSIDYFAKKKKNKILNLLNREGVLINFLKSMKIKTTHNFFKARKRPRNNVEMNNLLINSFGLNRKTPNEFSKQLYTLNENFFSAMKKMKKQKVEIEERNFLDKRNSNSSNLSVDIMKENERIWEQKFMENIYKDKLSEYEFNELKGMLKIKQKNNIIKHSKNFADAIMNINFEEYEYPNQYNIYKSSGNNISINNINRIRKMERLMKDVEKKEQFNVMDLNIEQLKSIQKKSETDGVLAIVRAGKPRFVKTKFKQTTIEKYKSVSGEYFGLPA